jgi:hypothetical protein
MILVGSQKIRILIKMCTVKTVDYRISGGNEVSVEN